MTKARPILQAQINAGGLPCVNRCRMGGVVFPGQKWDVGHIIGLAQGGTNAYSNLGASHSHCNRSDGGREGARKTNQAKAQTRNTDKRNQPW